VTGKSKISSQETIFFFRSNLNLPEDEGLRPESNLGRALKRGGPSRQP
jgi:hypothetical protein